MRFGRVRVKLPKYFFTIVDNFAKIWRMLVFSFKSESHVRAQDFKEFLEQKSMVGIEEML